ncbi:MAG: TonB-dependent receptor [Acidobacteria bacterium]|nr:TonB-dependent receptor [Acidobacteriota bacterium]
MTGIRNTGNPLPNPDAVREMSVQTSNFSAQFGRSSGGVVTVLTKSGTNSFHGSAFEFYRERNLNAQTHNVPPSAGKVPYNQHRFGFTVGGPIHKDRTFFFGSYAGFRYISSNVLVNTVPSAAMRTGNFSENLPTTGLTGSAACAATSTATKFYACNPASSNAAKTPYPGNIVPIAAFDPTIRAIMDAGLIPLPNPSASSDSVYTRRDLQRFTQQRDEYLVKGEHKLTPTQALTLSYFHMWGKQLLNPSGNNVAGWTQHIYNFTQHNANVQHVWTISNNTVNQLFLGYTRLLGGRVATPAESLAAYGSTLNVQGTPSRSQLAVSGWFQAGNAITGPVTGANVYIFRDVVSSTHGKHTLYFGGEANLEKDAQQTLLNNYGIFSFSQANNTANRTSAAITDFFFGRPNTFNQDSPVYANANYWNYGVFFQDDWRTSSRLTVNLGVRYDVQTTPLDTMRRTLNFKAGVQSTAVPLAPTGLQFPGDPGVAEGGTPTEYTHISPRVGFAWNVYGDGKTIVHAGAGIFYGTVSGNQFAYPSNNQPYAVRAQYKKVLSVADPYTSDPAEFCPTGTGCTVGVSPYPYNYDPKAPRFIRPSSIIAVDPEYKWPRIYQINVGIQQQFTPKFALTINYVGSMGRNMPVFRDYNYPLFNVTAAGLSGIGPGCTTAQACGYTNTTSSVDNRRPLNQPLTGGSASPTYSNVYVIQSSESSNYHGLQVSAEQRLTHNFSIKGFYIWSRNLASLDLDTSGNTGNSADSAFEDPNLHFLDKQRSDYDRRHQSVISFVYKANHSFKSGWVRALANGWTATSIITMQSGAPLNITTGTDVNADAINNDRPNLSGIGKPRLTDNHGSRTAAMANWVNVAYFCTYSATNPAACPGAGPAGSDGTFRRNELDGPGQRSIDASLFRDFKVWENVKFQLRGESTNVFNLTNLPNPTTTVSSASGFGRINGSIDNSNGNHFGNRIIQIGARILF